MDMLSSRAINGITINDDPKPEIISENVSPRCMISPVVSFRMSGIENDGIPNAGIPDGISPIIIKSYWPERCSKKDIIAVNMTKIAFRDVPVNQIILLTTRWNVDLPSSSFGPIFTDTNNRINSSTTIQERPMHVSDARAFLMFWNIDDHSSTNVSPLALMPI